MRVKFKFICAVIIMALLCSCSAPVAGLQTKMTSAAFSQSPEISIPASPSPSSLASPAASEASPSPSVTESAMASPKEGGYSLPPGSLPDLTDADRNKFNPAKVFSYLAEDGCITYYDYWYTINSSEVKDGVLCLALTLNISLADVNNAYIDLKTKRSLTDKQIRRIPVFSDCVIKSGKMYVDEDIWEDRKSYSSYKEWQDANDGYVNFLEQQKLKIKTPVPVSEDAQVTFYGYSDDKNYSRLSMKQFEDYLSDPDNLDEENGAQYIIDFVYFQYSDGNITSVYGNSGELE